MAILLDTSAYSLIDRNNKGVIDAIRYTPEILISATVLGELYYGFMRGKHKQRNLDDLERFLESPRVRIVDVGAETADRFARIKLYVQEQGRPIPSNDIWIAASAMEHSAELITADKHFGFIPHIVTKQVDR